MSGKLHKNAGPKAMNIFWEWDQIAPYPMTVRIKLDHQIDGEELCRAFEEALSVWPLLKDSFLPQEDGNIWFVENENPIRVHHTKDIIAAGKGPNDNRLIALSYDGDVLSFTGLHSFLDGGSLFMVMKGTLCRYLAKHFDQPGEVKLLPGPGDGDLPENYEFYIFRKDTASMPFEYKEAYLSLENCFMDARTKKQEGTPLVLSRVEVESDAFISYCKQNGANPSVMLVILMAQAMYRNNPEEQRPFAGLITMNIRHALGIDMAIMGQSSAMIIDVTRDELETKPFTELIREKRASMDAQRSRDYLLSRADDMRNAKPFMRAEYTFRLSYFGEFDYGGYSSHVEDILTYNEAYDEVHMFSINGRFFIDLQLGSATEEYVGAVLSLLREAGVNAKAAEELLPIKPVTR